MIFHSAGISSDSEALTFYLGIENGLKMTTFHRISWWRVSALIESLQR
jgi:hypothetical protein